MLEMRPSCEHCDTALPSDAENAMICSFECTFCSTCVSTVLLEVCPNCFGGFTKRPKRSKKLAEKYPVSTKKVHKPIAVKAHQEKVMKL